MIQSQQLFEIQKFQILSRFVDGGGTGDIDPTYAFAWDEGIYPLRHDGAPWHKPFADVFTTGPELVESTFNRLLTIRESNEQWTFWELEERLGIHGDFRQDGPISRGQLVALCRYFCQCRLFGKPFWNMLTENETGPVESHAITQQFRASDVFFQ